MGGKKTGLDRLASLAGTDDAPCFRDCAEDLLNRDRCRGVISGTTPGWNVHRSLFVRQPGAIDIPAFPQDLRNSSVQFLNIVDEHCAC